MSHPNLSRIGFFAHHSGDDARRQSTHSAWLAALFTFWGICLNFVSATGAPADRAPATESTRMVLPSTGLALTLPVNWTSIPLKQFNALFGQAAENSMFQQLVAAFQRGINRNTINRPFCMVHATESGWRAGPTPQQFDIVVQAMSAGSQVVTEQLRKLALYSPTEIEDYKALLATTSPGPLHVDQSSRRFWRLVDGTDEYGQPVRSLSSTMFLTNGNMITLNCYENRARFKSLVADFATIDRSMSDIGK